MDLVERALLLAALVLAAVAITAFVRARVARTTALRLGRLLPEHLPVPMPGAPTVVYFYGAACAACATQRQELEGLPPPLNLVAVDAADDPRAASWAGVLTVPSTAIVDGARRLRAVNHGFKPAEALAQQIAALA